MVCMFNYNKRNVTIFSLILAIVIYILILIILNSFKTNPKKEESSTLVLKTSQTNPITSVINGNKEEALEEISLNQYKQYNWRIIISKINLDASILEGTNKEVLRRGVGHFETTSKWDGNVCLAAHNRGYKYNYFQELKSLKMGDIIIYQTEKGKRTYSVEVKEKIKETDWSKIKETKENYLTLLTCVENMPEYRLCIQAKEIKS